MENIKLNDDTPLDLAKLIESRLLVQANSGGGKSWLIRRLLEQTHGKVQQIVIDPEGEFSSLREKFDYILAGKEGDTPADPRSAALLARKLLELNVSAIIDLYELHPQDRKRFVRLFLEAMINSPKNLHHPCLVVIDEAHSFAPEHGQSEALDAVIGLCSLGRKRKFCAVLATQRIAKLHKDTAAELNNKLIGRTGLDIDRKRAGEELGFTSKEQIVSLRTLAPGEFYAFGPAISNEVIKVRIGGVKTTHAATGDFQTKIAPPTSKIKKLLPQLADLPAEAKKEAATISELQNEIRNLKHENRILQGKPKVTNPDELEKSVKQELQKHIIAFGSVENGYKNKIQEWKAFAEKLMRLIFDIGRLTEEMRVPTEDIGVKYAPEKITKPIVGVDMAIGKDKTVKTVIERKPDNTLEITDAITNPEQRILDAIAWLEAVGVPEPENSAVAFVAGYSVTSSGFSNTRSLLRTKGLIEYKPGVTVLTDAGRSRASAPDAPLTTEELHNKVMAKLPGPEQKLLRPLIQAYPSDLSNEELAEQSGYSPTSSGFSNTRSRLRTLGLIEYPQPGRAKARPILFL